MTEFPVGSPLPGTMGSGRRDVLTVAQLLSRSSSGRAQGYTPVARESSTIAAQVVSVGSLLRREGRAPHAQDRPLQPRAARQAEASGAWPARPASGRRRATAVAGALVATGSVLGAALYNGAASHSSDAQAAADGLFPGMGLPAPIVLAAFEGMGFGIEPVTPPVVAGQQKIADTFASLKLIPSRIDVASAVWAATPLSRSPTPSV